jgi:hypothetical protein
MVNELTVQADPQQPKKQVAKWIPDTEMMSLVGIGEA